MNKRKPSSPRILKAIDRPRVALSFDDGYLEHYHTAELLHAQGVSATYFIITGLRSWNNRPLLTMRPDLIRLMREMGHEIASHSVSHPDLRKLTDAQVRIELLGSKEYLECLLEEDVQGLAYPYGSYSSRIRGIASRYYGYARTAKERVSSTRYELPIRSPGLSLRLCSVLMTRSLLTGRDACILLIHRIDAYSLRLCLEYLRLFRVRFVTVSEIVASKLGATEAARTRYPLEVLIE